MENHQIAAVFEEIANLMKILQDDPKWQFKAVAYDRAKRSIESYSERLEDIARDPNRKLTEIPGVGADFAKKIEELITTGQCQYHQEQLKRIPRSMLEILQLQGVGPQKVRMFYEKLKIETIEDLALAAQDGRLRDLDGMSEKSEQNILKAVENYQRSSGRFRLDVAYETADELEAHILQVKGVERVTPAGSLRRGRETVGDLDLLITGDKPARVAEHFLKFPRIVQVLARGADKVSVKLLNRMQVDIRILAPESFGAALMYFTGSKEHNV